MIVRFYVPQRFTTGISGWIGGEVGHELYVVVFYCIPYRCRIGQPDTLQHNGMTNSEMEMCMWK